MSEKKQFIKILDEQVANALCTGGFSYIAEKINESQTIYAFEETAELMDALAGIFNGGNFQEAIFVRDCTLNF